VEVKNAAVAKICGTSAATAAGGDVSATRPNAAIAAIVPVPDVTTNVRAAASATGRVVISGSFGVVRLNRLEEGQSVASANAKFLSVL
jgi:antitoxin (DNA-binding transcriptional repressor) of toxin-antitoxin stability system